MMLRFWLLLLFLCCGFRLAAQEQPVLEVTKIAPDVYIHTSYKMFGNYKVPSHGMVVKTTDGVVLIDTGWGNEATIQLLQWVKQQLGQPVKLCVVTHFHDDRMGGIKTLQKAGTPVISSALTATLATTDTLGTPDLTFAIDTSFVVGKQQFIVYYPGAGHTQDNLVVYLPKQKILFGGCLVKDAQATNLGNVADADLNNWPNAIKNVQKRFPKAKTVIPSHGPWGTTAALTNTLKLLEKR